MFGFILFSAVVLSTVKFGSSAKIFATIQLNMWSNLNEACVKGDKNHACLPNLYATVTVADNHRFMAAYPKYLWEYGIPDLKLSFPDVVATDIQIPIFLRVMATVKLRCPDGLTEHCYGAETFVTASVVRLIKVPKFSSSSQHFEAILPFEHNKLINNVTYFNFNATLIVNYDPSVITEGSECDDFENEDPFCPSKQPYSCPIFSDTMQNPCCHVNCDASCMLRNQSNIKTTTNPTTTATTPVTTTTIPTTIKTVPTTTATVLTTTTIIPSTTTLTTTISTTTTSSSTSTIPATSTSIPTTTSHTTSVIPITAVKTDSTLTTTARLPSKSTSSTNTMPTSTTATPSSTTSTTATTTVGSYQDFTTTSQIATASDTTATTTSSEDPESTSPTSTTTKKLCTLATTTTETVCPTCRENVYFWVMIEFILLTAVLLISLIFIAICNPKLESQFVEEEESDEEDPQ